MRSLLIVIFIVFLTACGKKGILYYPDLLVPSAPTSTFANQRGDSIKLQFVLPENDRAGRSLTDLAGVKISRRESDETQEQLCNSCMTDYRLFRKLYLDILSDGAQRYGKRVIILDGEVSAGKSYSYVVAPFTKDGMDGLSSSQVSVRMVQPMLPPVIHAESFPTEIRISFVSIPPVDQQFIGYNLYRAKQQNAAPYLPINREPTRSTEYIDSGLDRNTTYRYTARTVLKLASGDVVESLVSNMAEGMLKNDE